MDERPVHERLRMRRLDVERPVEERQPDLGRSQGIRGRGPSEQPALPGERVRILGHRLEHPLPQLDARERLTLRRQRLGGEQHVVHRELGFTERRGIIDQRNRLDTGQCVIPRDLCKPIAQTLLNDELLDERGCVELVEGVEMPLGCVDITDIEGDGRGEHSSVGVVGVDRHGVLNEGPGVVDVPLETQEPRLVRKGLRVGWRQLENVVVHVDCGVEITLPEQLLSLEQELSGGDPDITGDRVVECPTAGELGDENPSEGGNDGDTGQPHPAGSLRCRCLDRRRALPRLDCSKHPSGAGGVVGLQ